MKNLLKMLDEVNFLDAVGYIVMFYILFASLILFVARV